MKARANTVRAWLRSLSVAAYARLERTSRIKTVASPKRTVMQRGFGRFAVLLTATIEVVVCGLAWAQPAPEGASGWRDRKPIVARHFIIAAANPLAVDAGYAMLARGGTAVDAAIAAQLVLGLVEPQSSGLGGGGFMLVHDAAMKRLIAYDGRETAPAAAKPDRFLDRDGKPLRFLDAVIGGRSVGVPGTVALLETVHRAHGRLRWATLFEPAITLAEQGFDVSPRLAASLLPDVTMGNDRARRYFSRDGGGPLKAGDRLRNPAYAQTLRTLAEDGARAFYTGAIANDVVATANSGNASPGDLALADLAAYRVKTRAPVCGPYRNYRVCGMPLPSSGGPTVLQMLTMLEPYDLASMGPASFWSTHFIAEAGRLAYADRGAYMADPDFAAPPPGLLDRAYLASRGALIKPTATLGRATPGTPPDVAMKTRVAGLHDGVELPSTSHLSIVDAKGNAVSFTTTIENGFGSRLMTEGGFLLNNELTDFSFVATDAGKPVANRVEPGKRPRSSMAPTIVYDAKGRVSMITGSPGGSSIINYVVKTLVAVIDWDLDPQAAIALPNFGSRNGPTELERGTSIEALRDKLVALGHDVQVIELTSGAQAIVRKANGWVAGADPRREGTARGR
ncbi:MAG TPA: gamma-glutamyltransferase [Casimicrobiaceae bacterium]|nr:gamma-glutamyltransferase [Casimicrobiaceae bacterium]